MARNARSVLTIAYITNRKTPMFDWFFAGLNRECGGNHDGIEVVIVDSWHDWRQSEGGIAAPVGLRVTRTAPMPTPWQGQHRLTDHDAFTAACARNTGICMAQGSYIVFCDDLSVMVQGWLAAVREAMALNRIVLGAYRKVLELEVDPQGNLTHWLPHKAGVDSRWREGEPVPRTMAGNGLFGCSFGAPMEVLLEVNGHDQCLDGLSFEDVCLGLRLVKAGHTLWYDQRMLTFESEELHHAEPAFRRHNRKIPGYQDVAWEMLAWIASNPPQSRGTPNLREIRAKVLAGEPFPMHDGFFVWPDGNNLLGT